MRADDHRPRAERDDGVVVQHLQGVRARCRTTPRARHREAGLGQRAPIERHVPRIPEMSDRFRAMRLWAFGLVLCACGDDPKLHVRVEHDAGLPITRTEVSVYESASMDCIDVAFSRVGADELAAAFVTKQEVSATGETTGELTGISRTDHKVIVARGYDQDGNWRAAGCEEQDEVDGDVTVTVKTMRTVSTSLVPLEPDGADPFVAAVAVTDFDHKGVNNRRLGWTVYAPA